MLFDAGWLTQFDWLTYENGKDDMHNYDVHTVYQTQKVICVCYWVYRPTAFKVSLCYCRQRIFKAQGCNKIKLHVCINIQMY